jgi:hypothetical protein
MYKYIGKVSLAILLLCFFPFISFSQAPSGGAGANNVVVSPKIEYRDSATFPPLNITARSSAPSAPVAEDIYLDDGTNCAGGSGPCLRRYTGAVWEDIDNLIGFPDPMTTRGDLIYKNAAGTTTRLPAGSADQILTSDGTDIAWADASGGSSGASVWTAESPFSRTDDDTVLITAADCTNWPAGTPLRFSADESTWYYGISTACTDNGATISVDFDGAPLTTARDDYLSYGAAETLKTVQLVGVGNASVSDTWFPKYLWGGQSAYFVRIFLYVDTAPTGSTLEGNIEVDGTNALDTEFSIAASGTSTDSGTTLDDSTYSNTLIEQDEFVEIDISQVGSTVPGGNAAWAKLYFVTP